MRDARVVARDGGNPYNLRAEKRLSALEAKASGVAVVPVAAGDTDWEGTIYDPAITEDSVASLTPAVGASNLKVMVQVYRLGVGYLDWNAWSVGAAVGAEALRIHWRVE